MLCASAVLCWQRLASVFGLESDLLRLPVLHLCRTTLHHATYVP